MNYISLFAGIEAASVAWGPLGWSSVAFSEIEPFCCDLLKERYPNTPNLGDVSQIDWSGYEGTVDLVIGGSPCQAFSVAGRRKGLMDERGQLMLEYVRCIRETKPRWFIWENVPGVLSQDGGRAFGTLLRELEDCGYSMCWRVLDSQFVRVPLWDDNGDLAGWFGPVAQRRRRVFLVGHPIVGCAASVLFDPYCLSGGNQPSRGKRKELAARAGSCAAPSYSFVDRCGKPGGGKGILMQEDVASTLSTCFPQTVMQDVKCLNPWDSQTSRVYSTDGVYPTLQAGENSGMSREAVLMEALPFNTTQVTSPQNGNNPQWGDPCHTLASTDHPPAIVGRFKIVENMGKGWYGVECPMCGAWDEITGDRIVKGDVCHECGANLQGIEEASCLGFKYEQGAKAGSIGAQEEQSPTITTEKPPAVCYPINTMLATRGNTEDDRTGLGIGDEDDPAYTLTTQHEHAVCYAIAGNMIGREAKNGPNGKGYYEECAPTLTTADQHAVAFSWNQGFDVGESEELSPTLRAAHSGEPAVVCMADDTSNAAIDENLCGTLKCGGSAPTVVCSYIVRRLMPVECERLQGFPDGWTQLGDTADAPRYKALGNSMAVPVIRFLGEAIEVVDAL